MRKYPEIKLCVSVSCHIDLNWIVSKEKPGNAREWMKELNDSNLSDYHDKKKFNYFALFHNSFRVQIKINCLWQPPSGCARQSLSLTLSPHLQCAACWTNLLFFRKHIYIYILCTTKWSKWNNVWLHKQKIKIKIQTLIIFAIDFELILRPYFFSLPVYGCTPCSFVKSARTNSLFHFTMTRLCLSGFCFCFVGVKQNWH